MWCVVESIATIGIAKKKFWENLLRFDCVGIATVFFSEKIDYDLIAIYLRIAEFLANIYLTKRILML